MGKLNSNPYPLSDLANDLVNSAKNIISMRKDYKPTQGAEKKISMEVQNHFACAMLEVKERYSRKVAEGLFCYEDVEHECATWLEGKIVVDTYQMANCDAFNAYVMAAIIQRNLSIPITLIHLVNYDHGIVALGLEGNEPNLKARGQISIEDPLFQQVIFIDLWNKENPVFNRQQFSANMKKLFTKEEGFCTNKKAIGRTDEFNVYVQTHIRSAHPLNSFYLTNKEAIEKNAVLVSKRYYAFLDSLTKKQDKSQTTWRASCSFFAKSAMVFSVAVGAALYLSSQPRV